MNKYFRAAFIDHNDDEALHNTFTLYVTTILFLIAIILDQWSWNPLTCFALCFICTLLYKIGFRIGRNLHT